MNTREKTYFVALCGMDDIRAQFKATEFQDDTERITFFNGNVVVGKFSWAEIQGWWTEESD
jgi:hypothetical protein